MTANAPRLFDVNNQASCRSATDYDALAAAGIEVIVEPSSWHGEPRTHVGTFEDYFSSLLGWEPFRAARSGVRHVCALALNPREANDPGVADGVLELLPRYLDKDGVVAVGATGFEDLTPAEERALVRHAHLAAARELPLIIRAPAREKSRAVRRSLEILRDCGIPPTRVLICGNVDEVTPEVLDAGCWSAHCVDGREGVDEAALVSLVRRFGVERVLVGSGADWAGGDPLAVAKAALALLAAGFGRDTVETLTWRNPSRFFGQSGRLDIG